MYIEPNTDIKILKNSPCDSNYINTLNFPSPEAQSNYFISLAKYNLNNYTYQRVNKGILRAGIQAENLYDCNYLMFRNTAFGTKWFYAFIDKVEYVNNAMSEIYFTIDVMQTWMFEYEVNDTFIEREHSITDVAGDNLVPEDLNLGELIIADIEQPLGWNDIEKSIVVGSTDWWDGDPDNPTWHEGTGATLIGGIFSGIHFQEFTGGNATARINAAATYLQKFADASRNDSILGVWETYDIYVNDDGYRDEIHTSRPLTLAGYTPINKKLLTYPYCFLEGASGDGNRHEYLYEYFDDPSNIQFNLRGSFNGTASLCMYPLFYKDVSPNYDEIMSYENASVQCAYTTDSFKAWLAQNSYNLRMRNGDLFQIPKGTIGGLVGGMMAGGTLGTAIGPEGTVGGAIIGGLAGMGISAGATISNILQKKQTTPNRGTLGAGSSLNHLLKLDVMRLNKKCITRQFAIKIDQYFNKYGYATNEIKKPNLDSRPHWNYVKTIGCSVKGSIPSDDEKKICAIYDNGITFWKNGNEVGDYSLDNSPT